MRTLKFRIYDKTEKRMKFLDSVWNMPDPSYDFDEIQQFTGLLDKHGKEIYEGDIVKYYTSFCGGKTVIKEITWNKDLNGFGMLENNVEIIGNIYENPLLLGGDNKRK